MFRYLDPMANDVDLFRCSRHKHRFSRETIAHGSDGARPLRADPKRRETKAPCIQLSDSPKPCPKL